MANNVVGAEYKVVGGFSKSSFAGRTGVCTDDGGDMLELAIGNWAPMWFAVEDLERITETMGVV